VRHTSNTTQQIFSNAPPPRNDFGFDTLGWKHGGDSLFWGTTTTISGPLTHPPSSSSDPRQNPKPSFSFFSGFSRTGRTSLNTARRRHSDEDHIAAPLPPEGIISTKTTVEVQSHAMPGMYAGSDFSGFEMEDKSERARSPASAGGERGGRGER
jgi:hypothetical protein